LRGPGRRENQAEGSVHPAQVGGEGVEDRFAARIWAAPTPWTNRITALPARTRHDEKPPAGSGLISTEAIYRAGGGGTGELRIIHAQEVLARASAGCRDWLALLGPKHPPYST